MKVPALALIACLVLCGCCCNDPPPDPPAKDELEGLRALTPRVQRVGPGRVEVTYVLEWTGAPTIVVDEQMNMRSSNLWLLGPGEPVIVSFFDAGDRPVGSAMERIAVPAAFLDRSQTRLESLLTLDAPAGAAALRVALGRSGLETRQASIP